MKTQKIHQITVSFENFNFSFSRDLLAQMLAEMLGLTVTGNCNPICQEIRLKHPSIVGVTLHMVGGRQGGVFKDRKFLISQITLEEDFLK